MVNKDTILKRVTKAEDKLFVSKLLDRAIKTEKLKCVTHSDFLDPYQKSLAERILTNCRDIDISFYGGYPGAEREVAFFYPDCAIADNDSEESDLIVYLKLKLKSKERMSHRDYLGSLMSIGIKREKTGDILVNDEGCIIIVLRDKADYIIYNLEKVANTRVEITPISFDDLIIPEQEIKEIKTTVASLRLDCVSSAGFRTSRSKMVDVIRGEKLSLNWEIVNDVSRQVKEGDTISIRGRGKVVVEKIDGKTRKNRTGIILKKLI